MPFNQRMPDWAEPFQLPRNDGWPTPWGRSDPFERTPYVAPTQVDAGSRFAEGRESQNVQDIRGRQSAWPQLDINASGGAGFAQAALGPQQDNKHTQAVDNLVARLQAYAPSRASLMVAPQTINQDTALDMAKYYAPPLDEDIPFPRRQRPEDIASIVARYKNLESPQ